jgi:hypothetical protein
VPAFDTLPTPNRQAKTSPPPSGYHLQVRQPLPAAEPAPPDELIRGDMIVPSHGPWACLPQTWVTEQGAYKLQRKYMLRGYLCRIRPNHAEVEKAATMH